MTPKDDTIPPTLRAVRSPPRPAPRRSLTPPTLRAADVHRLEVVHERLCFALRAADDIHQLRRYVIELAADVEAVMTTDRGSWLADGFRIGDTVPFSYGVPESVAAESAPSTPTDSDLADEYGPGGSLWYAART